MTKLPILRGEELVKLLESIGFTLVRQKGSHAFLQHSDGKRTVVPIHKGRDIDRGLLRKIIRDIEMTYEGFIRLIQKQDR